MDEKALARKKKNAERQRGYVARKLRENRCITCGTPRVSGDLLTQRCSRCSQKMNQFSTATWAKKRAQNPPDFSRAPDRPFRYGKTRLVSPRHLHIALDEETYFWIKACRQNYCRSDAYEPYQVSEVIRRLLATLQNDSGPIPPSPPMPRRGANIGLLLSFKCDAANFAVITRHHEAVGGSRANAVRDCIKVAAEQIITHCTDEEAKRILWPGYAEIADATPPNAFATSSLSEGQ